jgi:hypothetical protein
MDTLTYLVEKFGLDLTQASPIFLPISRETDLPLIFKDLDFKIGAEVGVYRGAYSEVLLKAIPNLKLFGVDLWDLYPGYRDYKKDDIRDAQLEATEKTKNYNCELIKAWSDQAVRKFADDSLDFVYIDGNHSFEQTVQDISLWSKKVRKGGIVCGHDYEDWSHNWRRFDMNVINAVTGWCTSYQINPWFVIKNDKHPSWMYVK